MSEGETWIIRLEARDAAGVPIDLTDGSAEWALSVEGGELIATFNGTITEPTFGLVDFEVAVEEHAGVVAGEYLYEVRVTKSDSTISTQLRGRMTVGESPFASDSVFGGVTRTREFMTIACSHESSEIATTAEAVVFHAPYPMVFTEVFIGLSAVSSAGPVTADLNRNGVTMFSTNPSIAVGEQTSLSGTAAVLSVTTGAKGDRIAIDIDAAGTGARGLKMYIIGYQTA